MRIHSYLLISMLILTSSCNNNQKHVEIKNDNSSLDASSKDSISVSYDSLGTYYFKFITDTAGDSLKTIRVYSKNKLLQEIMVNDVFETEIKKYEIVDVNFDGFKDILVLKGSGSGGNTYWVWNYSIKDNNFHFNNQLSDRFGLEIDSVHDQIMFSYSGGSHVKELDTFKYKNDKLILLSSKHIDGVDTLLKRK